MRDLDRLASRKAERPRRRKGGAALSCLVDELQVMAVCQR
jgi:hypothetical protein